MSTPAAQCLRASKTISVGNIWFRYENIHYFSGNEFTICREDAFPKADRLLEDHDGSRGMNSWRIGVWWFDGKQVVFTTENDCLLDDRLDKEKETCTGEPWFGRLGHTISLS